MLVGALTKSAIFPFHFWLPGAMAAPTPVSAYLHAAAMVKAGIYLVALLAPGVRRRARRGGRSCSASALVTMLARRLAGAARDTTSSAAGLRHGQPARLPDRAARRRHPGAGARRPGAAARARAVQGGAVPRRRRHRPRHRHPRPAPAVRARPAGAGARRRSAGWPAPRWPASRRCSASSPRRPRFAALLDGGLPDRTVAALVLAGLVLGSALTVAYTLRFLWGAFAAQAGPADADAGRAGPSARPLFLAAPARAGRWPGWSPGPAARCSSRWSPRTPTRCRWSRPRRDHLALWHGFSRRWCCRCSPSLGGALLFPVRGPVTGSSSGSPSAPRPTRATNTPAAPRPARRCRSPASPSAARCRSTSARSCSSCSRCRGAALLVRAPVAGGVRAWDTPVQALVGAVDIDRRGARAAAGSGCSGGARRRRHRLRHRAAVRRCTAPPTWRSPRSWSRR